MNNVKEFIENYLIPEIDSTFGFDDICKIVYQAINEAKNKYEKEKKDNEVSEDI